MGQAAAELGAWDGLAPAGRAAEAGQPAPGAAGDARPEPVLLVSRGPPRRADQGRRRSLQGPRRLSPVRGDGPPEGRDRAAPRLHLRTVPGLPLVPGAEGPGA